MCPEHASASAGTLCFFHMSFVMLPKALGKELSSANGSRGQEAVAQHRPDSRLV